MAVPSYQHALIGHTDYPWAVKNAGMERLPNVQTLSEIVVCMCAVCVSEYVEVGLPVKRP